MRLFGVLAMVSVVFVADAATAQTSDVWRRLTGDELLKRCRASQFMRAGCTSYIAAIIDTHETYSTSGYGRRLFCPAGELRIGDVRERVIGFLAANPKSLTNDAAGLTLAALKTAYPCAEKPRTRPRRR